MAAPTRTNKRLEHSREQVLETTLEMVAVEGLARVTVARLAERLGTSGGHLLYYFGTRNGLLLETLRWSEQRYAEQRAPLLDAAAGSTPPDPDPVVAVAEIYLPTDDKDPRWLLWLELWARAPYDAELAAAQDELDDAWHTDLVRLVGLVLPDVDDPAALSTRLRAMWDGFAIGIVTGGARPLRAVALDHTRALLPSGTSD